MSFSGPVLHTLKFRILIYSYLYPCIAESFVDEGRRLYEDLNYDLAPTTRVRAESLAEDSACSSRIVMCEY
jgi:hypothetical protein